MDASVSSGLPMGADQPRPPAANPWLRAAFPAALLLFSCFFFGGRLGWWSDDYWHNLRDPVTDQVQALVLHRGFFLRPLFYIVIPALTTLLWHHGWAAHAIQLASHALVVVLLWRLMLRLGLGRRAAGAAALLFMVYPAQFEALFWFSALPTSMSSALMLGVLLITARPGSGTRRLALMAAMTFAACCLNEQPASVVLAMPLLAWASPPAPSADPDQAASRSRSPRAFVVAAACGLAAAVYIALLRLSPRPPGVRGSAETLVTVDTLWPRTVHFCDVLWRRLVLKNFGGGLTIHATIKPGALTEGWTQITAAGWPAYTALAVVAALGIAPALRPQDGEPLGSPSGPIPNCGRIAVLGVAVFLAGWLPILAIAAYEPDPRCRYWPDIGLALITAAAIHAAGGALSGAARRAVPIAANLALAALLLAWSIMLVGVQAGFRARWRLDQSEFSELRRLIPSPAPYTMFIPLDIHERALATGAPVLDPHFRSVWEFPWTTIQLADRIYQRSDLRCGYWRSWTPGVPVAGGDEQGLHYDDPNLDAPRFPRLPDGAHLVPWDRTILFTVEKDHTLRIATRVVLEKAGEPDSVINLPQSSGLPDFAPRLPRR